jgi:hypothetical protein
MLVMDLHVAGCEFSGSCFLARIESDQNSLILTCERIIQLSNF